MNPSQMHYWKSTLAERGWGRIYGTTVMPLEWILFPQRTCSSLTYALPLEPGSEVSPGLVWSPKVQLPVDTGNPTAGGPLP